MRSLSTEPTGAASIARRRVVRWAEIAGPRAMAAAILSLLLLPPALGQYEPDDEPILPDEVASIDVEMSSRYVRQWRDEKGEFVLVFSGGFGLDMGPRRLSADDAVVWIAPRRSDAQDRKYYEMTVYLSGSAEVREPGGTTTEDSALLVSNLRTYGRIIKRHDAHSPEKVVDSVLYQQALAAREGRVTVAPPEPEPAPGIEVARPDEIGVISRPTPKIRWSLNNVETGETPDGRIVQVATGGVYLSRGGSSNAAVMEIHAENAVLFMSSDAGPLISEQLNGAVAAPREVKLADGEPLPQQPIETRREGADESSAKTFSFSGGLADEVEAVYLEGDVVLSMGERFVRANRIYYDFSRDKALILDAVLRTDIPEREVPLYVRASEIRQVSASEFSAERAMVSTSEFYTPHYHMGVGSIRLRDRTARDSAGAPAGAISGTYELTNATLNVEDVPVAWWPYSKGDFTASETLIRRFRTAYSDNRGAALETEWYLFDLLGVPRPEGVDASLRLDYYSERGPAIGVDGRYQQENFFGLTRNYYIYDEGEDNLGPLRDNVPDTKNRGRTLWRHRHYLPNDWELTFELAYASDPGFLEEYEKSEWFEEKEQETLVYLKRARDTEAITWLANWRLLDFTTQTEHIPELGYRRVGDTWLDPIVLYHESSVGGIRYQPDDRRFFDERRWNNDGETDVTLRLALRQEAELPIKLPGLNIVPFAAGRAQYWDSQPLDRHGLWRGFGLYGVRGGGYLGRVYDDIHSELFDIDRIRHIIQPHFVAWWSHSNITSDQITPFDEGIETIDDFYGFGLGVRQVWQTKRGGPGRQRTVDVLTFNIEAGLFGDAQDEQTNGYFNPIRPEDSRTQNYIGGDLIYRMSDTTTLFYDFNYDLDSRSFDRNNIAVAIERSPRLAYVFGWRNASDIDLGLLGGGYNYRLNEKHISAFRVWYDVDRGEIGEISLAYIRRLPRWYFSVNFEVDEVFDDVKVSLSLWPEGIPEWALGSRKYTGLSKSMGIKP